MGSPPIKKAQYTFFSSKFNLKRWTAHTQKQPRPPDRLPVYWRSKDDSIPKDITTRRKSKATAKRCYFIYLCLLISMMLFIKRSFPGANEEQSPQTNLSEGGKSGTMNTGCGLQFLPLQTQMPWCSPWHRERVPNYLVSNDPRIPHSEPTTAESLATNHTTVDSCLLIIYPLYPNLRENRTEESHTH